MMHRRGFLGALAGAVGLGALFPARARGRQAILIHEANTDPVPNAIVTGVTVSSRGWWEIEVRELERANATDLRVERVRIAECFTNGINPWYMSSGGLRTMVERFAFNPGYHVGQRIHVRWDGFGSERT